MFLALFLLTQIALSVKPPFQTTPWKPLPTLPNRVLEATGTLIFNQTKPTLILTGGYIEASNLSSTTSTTVIPLPATIPRPAAPHPFLLTHMAHASNKNVLYSCGGFLSPAPGVSSKLCHSYNIDSNTWNRLPDLPYPSGGGGMVYIKEFNALFYSGGTVRNNSFSGDDIAKSYILFLGNLSLGWNTRADMPDPRNHLAAVVSSSRVFFLGGQKAGNEMTGNSDAVHEYLWWADTWVVRKSIPFPLGHVSASVFAYWGGFIVVGGMTNSRLLSDKVLFYDIREDAWFHIATYPRKVQSPVCVTWGPVFCVSGFGKPGWANTGFSAHFSLPVRE